MYLAAQSVPDTHHKSSSIWFQRMYYLLHPLLNTCTVRILLTPGTVGCVMTMFVPLCVSVKKAGWMGSTSKLWTPSTMTTSKANVMNQHLNQCTFQMFKKHKHHHIWFPLRLPLPSINPTNAFSSLPTPAVNWCVSASVMCVVFFPSVRFSIEPLSFLFLLQI